MTARQRASAQHSAWHASSDVTAVELPRLSPGDLPGTAALKLQLPWRQVSHEAHHVCLSVDLSALRHHTPMGCWLPCTSWRSTHLFAQSSECEDRSVQAATTDAVLEVVGLIDIEIMAVLEK